MTTLLGTILADFTTNLATAITIGGTTATLQSATDDDGIALPAGRYFFTIDGENSSKEHFSCTLSGTSLSALKSVSRQGVETSGAVRAHRIGATVTLTDFAHLKYINDLVAGTTTFNASAPLGYDGTASITTANQLATKAYVDAVSIAGAADASTTVKGIVEEATQAEVLAKTAAGATSARLFVNPTTLASTLLSDYKVDTGSANAYVITPDPAITAYTVGQIFSFKAVNANTTTSTINVNGLGAQTIKKPDGSVLRANDILAAQLVVIEYDGTDMIMISPTGNAINKTGAGIYPAIDGSLITNVQISQSFPRGETVDGATTPVPVVLIDDTFQEEFLSGQNVDFGKVTTGNKMALGFKLQSGITLTTAKVYLRKQGAPTDNAVFTIETDTTGAPSGTPVANGTASGVAGTGLTTSYVLTTLTFGGTVTLAANTQYWLVAVRDSSTHDTNYYQVNGIANANKYASFTGSTHNATSWSTGGLVPYAQLVCATGSSTSVWRCDTDHANFHMRFAAGLVTTDGAVSSSASVVFRGTVSGFTGLTPNSIYYAQDTIGTLGLTAGTTEAIVGTSISTTQIVVGMGSEKPQFISSLALSWSGGAGTANDIGVMVGKYTRMILGDTIGSNSGGSASVQHQLTLYKNGKTSATWTDKYYTPSSHISSTLSWSGNTLTAAWGSDADGGSGTVYFYR